MRIILYGATGSLGQLILAEALSRGHEVTVVVRDPSRMEDAPNVTLRHGDVLDTPSVAALAPGHDVLVSAVGPGHGGDPSFLVEAARSLTAAAESTGVRLMVLGGAGSLEVAPGVQLLETPDFPAPWLGTALAHRDALDVYRAVPDAVDWTYVSPADRIEPGKRTGRYRTGGDQLVTDDQGSSHISAADLAVAIIDEVERPSHRRQRFTVAY
jgi:uncharacterized protein